MVDLIGEYRHKVDAKGRLSLPAKFRKEFAKESSVESGEPIELVVTIDPDGECLYVFLQEDFSKWVESFFAKDGGYNERKRAHKNARRILRGQAKFVEIDSAGRINLPADQREKAGLGREVALVGDGDRFEIWDPEALEEVNSMTDLGSMLYVD